MAAITYPLFTVTDDSGAVVSGATVAIASVKDRDGGDIASHGAILHYSGANVSVEYDAEAKGEAWIVLAVNKVGSTFSGLGAAPPFFLSPDPSRIAASASAVVPIESGTVSASPAPTGTTFTATGTFSATAGHYGPTPATSTTGLRTRYVRWTSGVNAGSDSPIASYAGSGAFTLAATVAGIAANDSFLII